jgi:hypothetical protein
VSAFSEQPFKQKRRAKKPIPGTIDLRTRAKTRPFINNYLAQILAESTHTASINFKKGPFYWVKALEGECVEKIQGGYIWGMAEIKGDLNRFWTGEVKIAKLREP